MMKVFVIERNDFDYDEIISVAVCAESEEEARRQAFEWCMNRPEWPYKVEAKEFLDPSKSKCEEVDISKPGVFHHYMLHG